MVPIGKYRARAVEADLGVTSTGKEQVAIRFTIIEGEQRGNTILWFAYFNTQENAKRTFESMRYCGWQGDDPTDLTGFDRHEVEIVVEHEEYDGRTRAKVRWVNELGGGPAVSKKMDPAQKAAFSARLKGLAIATRPQVKAASAANQNAQPRDYPDNWDAA